MSRDYHAKRLARDEGIPYAEALRHVRADHSCTCGTVDVSSFLDDGMHVRLVPSRVNPDCPLHREETNPE